VVVVGPRYLEALGTHTLRGREFTASDTTRVAVVNQRLAGIMASDGDAIGRQIKLDASGPAPATDWLTVVGVAPNIRQGSSGDVDAIDPVIYLPVPAAPIPALSIITRTSLPSGTVAATLRDRMRTLDQELPIYPTEPLEAVLETNRGEVRMLSDLMGGFAAIAFILAAVGLYAMTAFSVVQRTREIGVRMAVGAQTRDIVRLILRRASGQLLLGLVLGGAGAVAVARALAHAALRYVHAFDPATLVAVVAALVVIAALGCLIPARRGARLDPIAALRAE
jgi:putative ABC transport system permease protein